MAAFTRVGYTGMSANYTLPFTNKAAGGGVGHNPMSRYRYRYAIRMLLFAILLYGVS